ncbi:MAG: hypothetical protein ACYTAF_10555, partial [Planctomycetota bacterium]
MTPLDGLVLALAAMAVLVCASLSFRSLPHRLRAALDEAVKVALDARGAAQAVREEWTEAEIRFGRIVEELNAAGEVLEKRRARVATENRRADAREA